MTAWADVVAAAMVLIDDARLEEQLAVSPAQFYRRMSAWVKLAFPKLSRPPELLRYLNNGKTEPRYDDLLWTSTAESAEGESVVETGRAGYDLCSVTLRVAHPNGTVSLAPYPQAVYDPETGDVTFPRQEREGLDYDLDFYSDGAFPDLSESQMRLLALAMATLWDERFARNWLAMGPKIHDGNFNAPNETAYMEKSSKRLRENLVSFYDELKAYEQQCAYASALGRLPGRVTLS